MIINSAEIPIIRNNGSKGTQAFLRHSTHSHDPTGPHSVSLISSGRRLPTSWLKDDTEKLKHPQALGLSCRPPTGIHSQGHDCSSSKRSSLRPLGKSTKNRNAPHRLLRLDRATLPAQENAEATCQGGRSGSFARPRGTHKEGNEAPGVGLEVLGQGFLNTSEPGHWGQPHTTAASRAGFVSKVQEAGERPQYWEMLVLKYVTCPSSTCVPKLS